MMRRAGAPQVAAALLLLLVGQGIAVGVLRSGSGSGAALPAAACGTRLPQVDRSLPLDVQLQLRTELVAGGRSSGTAVVVNRGARPIAVLTTQLVLVAPAGRTPVSPPEPPRPATGLLRPGQ